MLDVWESQTTESALRWWTRHIVPRHTLEVVLEVILEHVLGIKTMTSLILDHVAIAYFYLGINTRKKVMILFVVIVLELSQDSSWLDKHALQSSLLKTTFKSHNFHFGITTITPFTTLVILVASTWHAHLTLSVSLRLAKRPSAQFANLQTRFYNTRTPFKRRSCYSPTSNQARVLVVQAFVAAYLQDLPSKSFSYKSLKQGNKKNTTDKLLTRTKFQRFLNQALRLSFKKLIK